MKAPNIAKYTDRKHYPNFKVCALLGRAAAAKRGAHIFHRAALMVSTGRSLRTTRAEELERERRREREREHCYKLFVSARPKHLERGAAGWAKGSTRAA
jgi:hypothetical protein